MEQSAAMSGVSLQQVIACPKLPSLPAVATRVLELAQRDDVRLEEVAEVVRHDQALTARILKTVNASYYGLATPCPTIDRALGYLGLSTVKSLVLGFTLLDQSSATTGGFDLLGYWQRGLYAAAGARRVSARLTDISTEEAFLSALMQDVGMLALHRAVPEAYAEVLAQAPADHSALSAIEQELLGFTHADVGGALLRQWRLPDHLVEGVQRHHDPVSIDDPLLTRVVVWSARAAAVLAADSTDAAFHDAATTAGQWFNLSPQDATEILLAIGDDARELAETFCVSIGDGPDTEALLARAEEAAIAHQLRVQRMAEQLQRANCELARQASTDGLTGVENRAALDREAAALFDRAVRGGAPLGVLLLDADRFKAVNDTYGHLAGDAVLVELARRAIDVIGPAGTVYRYGGEEFVVLLPGATLSTVAKTAERLRRAVCAGPFDLSGVEAPIGQLDVTVSIGAACCDAASAPRFRTMTTLLRAADRAVYAAKAAGRNCVRVFAPRDTADAA